MRIERHFGQLMRVGEDIFFTPLFSRVGLLGRVDSFVFFYFFSM